MRSHDVAWVVCLLTLVLAAATLESQTDPSRAPIPEAAADAAPADEGVPTDADIARALEQIRDDPNVAGTRTLRTLRWRESERRGLSLPGWLRWLRDLFGVIAQSSRFLAWLAVGAAIVALVVFLSRSLSGTLDAGPGGRRLTPTHVRDLDIRPESLPDDIGAAARTLWDEGARRGALALLYRGLLSRLAHAHRVPIRDSTTEGDCMALSARHLDEPRHAYVARLVRVWQRAVYGGVEPDTPTVHDLCSRFSGALDPAPLPDRDREAAV